MKLRKDEQGFITTFNPENGFSIRTDIVDKDGNKTEPFMATGPELLDICITKYCPGPLVDGVHKPCSYCYMNSVATDEHKSMYLNVDEFRYILEQNKGDVFQVALGGGEPTTHPNFIEILRICKEEYDVIPNYTTNGINLTAEILEATKKYCGAVAVSLHDVKQCANGMAKLINYGIKTNIHVVVTKERATCKFTKSLIESLPFVENKLNAVIFLLHKPVGRANINNQPTALEAEAFVKNILEWKPKFKIGFDACFAPALVRNKVDSTFFDYCDGGRFSGFVDWDMMMYPCSFASSNKRNGMSLRDHAFKEIWNSKLFDGFRSQFKTRCNGCADVKVCGGGCPLLSEIIPCSDRYRFERWEK